MTALDSSLDAIQAAETSRTRLRSDLRLVADWVEPGTRVLDIGCGDGALLDHLVHAKGVDGRGIEIKGARVSACVAQGLSVIQGDANTDLKDYPSNAFDTVILSQTLQATNDPKGVLTHLLRIGRRAIVSMPNFGYWKVRLNLLARGRMPVTGALGYQWYETPNIHLCTIKDFISLCDELGIRIVKSLALDAHGRPRGSAHAPLSNLMGEQALFLLAKNGR